MGALTPVDREALPSSLSLTPACFGMAGRLAPGMGRDETGTPACTQAWVGVEMGGG